MNSTTAFWPKVMSSIAVMSFISATILRVSPEGPRIGPNMQLSQWRRPSAAVARNLPDMPWPLRRFSHISVSAKPVASARSGLRNETGRPGRSFAR